jgi:hypothetical protein
MNRPQFEITDVISQFENEFYAQCNPNEFQRKILRSLAHCRTSQLGYHKEQCDNCGEVRISYNSCRNRHCPKCQSLKQAFWVEDLLEATLPIKHYHIVFTIPHELNEICILNSAWFYGQLFASVWDTLRTFGYTHFGAETGAVCVLHTWGQNLSLHPHIHCIVPAAGQTLAGNMKNIGNTHGKYLYPVRQLSSVFRGKFMETIKTHLQKQSILEQYKSILHKVWQKPWVVFCEPSFGKPEHVVQYLGQYTHRVAITNQRIIAIDKHTVTFLHKDYNDGAKQKPITLSGVEFLRRFCLHILPLRFVKIRRYGIYSSRYKVLQNNVEAPTKMIIKTSKQETVQQRILRITGFDICKCPRCKIGRMHTIEIVPCIRSPNIQHTSLLMKKE